MARSLSRASGILARERRDLKLRKIAVYNYYLQTKNDLQLVLETPEGSEESPRTRGDFPLEARIISVADTYDSLTSDQPHRKAMSPIDAKETIVRGAGEEFDPMVVEAFLKAFRKGELEIPDFVLQ